MSHTAPASSAAWCACPAGCRHRAFPRWPTPGDDRGRSAPARSPAHLGPAPGLAAPEALGPRSRLAGPGSVPPDVALRVRLPADLPRRRDELPRLPAVRALAVGIP